MSLKLWKAAQKRNGRSAYWVVAGTTLGLERDFSSGKWEIQPLDPPLETLGDYRLQASPACYAAWMLVHEELHGLFPTRRAALDTIEAALATDPPEGWTKS